MDIKNYIKKSMSYEEYWDFFETLVKEKKTNWNEQSEEMINYTKLNFQRSKRIHKQFKLLEELREELNDLDMPITWLAITEPWCGDASQNIPVFYEISKCSDLINFRVVLRDENPELINQFQTKGTISIPKIIQLDDDYTVIETWGPRPEVVQSKVMEFKMKPWTDKQKFYEELQGWYNIDKSMTLQNEILSMLNKIVNA